MSFPILAFQKALFIFGDKAAQDISSSSHGMNLDEVAWLIATLKEPYLNKAIS
jgi:hypothetical protein